MKKQSHQQRITPRFARENFRRFVRRCRFYPGRAKLLAMIQGLRPFPANETEMIDLFLRLTDTRSVVHLLLF